MLSKDFFVAGLVSFLSSMELLAVRSSTGGVAAIWWVSNTCPAKKLSFNNDCLQKAFNLFQTHFQKRKKNLLKVAVHLKKRN